MYPSKQTGEAQLAPYGSVYRVIRLAGDWRSANNNDVEPIRHGRQVRPHYLAQHAFYTVARVRLTNALTYRKADTCHWPPIWRCHYDEPWMRPSFAFAPNAREILGAAESILTWQH
jgi:hypothetical protein